MKYLKHTAIAAAAMTAALALGGCSSTQLPDVIQVQNVDSASDIITVTGKESVKATPDMARVTYTISTSEPTADACQQKNAADLNAAIETLKGLGVAETSMQTSNYGLSPIRNWQSSTQEITGYTMETTLTVSDIPIDDCGALISQAVAAGVNGINSVDYFCSNYDASYQEALQGAVKIARTKAEALAAASGRTLGEAVRVEEYGYNPSTRYSNARNASGAAKMAVMAEAEDMAVMPGQVDVEAQVTIDFSLQ